MRFKHLKLIAFILLFVLTFLTINSSGKNAIEDLVEASNKENEALPIPSFTAQLNDIEFEVILLISQSLTGAKVSIHPFGYALGIKGQYLLQDLKITNLKSVLI